MDSSRKNGRVAPLDYFLLLVAVLSVSSAAILVRLSGVHGFAAATWRLVLGSLITFVIAFAVHKKIPRPPRASGRILLLVASGVALGLHFDLWMLSLQYLYVALSVIIVDSYPLVLLLLGRLVAGERYNWLQVSGAVLAMSGIFLLFSFSGEELVVTGSSLVAGVLLAFTGMVALSLYLLAGKLLRREMDTWSYTLYAYSVAAATSLFLSMALGVKLWGYYYTQCVYLLLLAIIPMIGGHTVLNYLLRKMSLLGVAVPVLGEPIGASLLALILFGEEIPLQAALFMAITLTGIGLTIIGEEKG